MVQLYDYLFKLIFTGDAGTGKTTILHKLSNTKYPSVPTIGVDYSAFYHKIAKIDNEKIKDGNIKCQVWDTAGQEKFAPIIRSYYSNVAAAIIVYDITDHSTFGKIDYWYNDLITNIKHDIPVIIVGNKTDQKYKRVITTEEGKNKADKLNCLFFETNKDDNSVLLMMDCLLKNVYKNKDEINQGIRKGEDILKDLADYDKNRGCCCIC